MYFLHASPHCKFTIWNKWGSISFNVNVEWSASTFQSRSRYDVSKYFWQKQQYSQTSSNFSCLLVVVYIYEIIGDVTLCHEWRPPALLAISHKGLQRAMSKFVFKVYVRIILVEGKKATDREIAIMFLPVMFWYKFYLR